MADELVIDSKALIFATLADVYLSSGMVDEAISILKDGLSRNPNYTLGKIILGRALYMKGSIDEAMKTLEAIYTEAKDSENANLYLARCHKRIGDTDKAAQFYEQVLRINPQNKDARQELESIAAKAAPPAETIEEKTEIPPLQEPPASPLEAVVVAVPIMDQPAAGEKPPDVEKLAQEPPAEHIPILDTIQPMILERIETQKHAEEPVPAQAIPPEETAAPIQPPAEPEPVETKAAPEPEPVPEPELTRAEKVAEIEKLLETDREPVPAPAAQEKPSDEVPILPEIGFETVETAASVKTPEAPGVSPLDSLKEPMSHLLKLKAVKGAFICSRDGLLIQNSYTERADTEEIAALIAAICNEADDSFKFLKEGAMERCIIEKGDESICVITAGESLLCIVTKPEAKPGLVFVYARKIIDQIREILG